MKHHNVESPIWNTQYGIPNMEYPIWNTQYGIPNTEYPIWNTQYGIPNMEYTIWNTKVRITGYGSRRALHVESGVKEWFPDPR